MATKMAGRKRLLLTVVGVLGLLPLTGCGNSLSSECVPVGGTVTLDGQPLEDDYRVVFTPDASKGNAIRAACIGAVQNGRYEVISLGVARSERGSGTPPGWYKVSLQRMGSSPAVNPLRSKASNPSKASVNPIYLDPEKTPLEVEVVANPSPGAYDLRLTR